MKALVTGGTGFLGRAVIGELLRLGYEVTSYDNDFRGTARLLPKGVIRFQADIRDGQKLIEASKDCDLLVHLAFINGTRYFYEIPHLVTEVGIKGILNVNEAISQNAIGNFILFSSSEVYQTANIFPTPEQVELTIPDVLNPRYSYGGSKIASELVTTNLIARKVNSWKIVRPHNIYGPKMGSEHVIPELFRKVNESTTSKITIEGNGTQTRSFCHINDFATAFMLIINDSAKNQIYNVGSREEISITQLANMIIKISGKEINIVESLLPLGGTMRRCPDITKIENLGFKQSISLECGLKDYYEQLIKI